ncbi:5858_t:CDS:1 [Cetraspora pellucida]|uniref:5858_t:CDS:1 n=1 Tax=Cetraspora pellucida TaxID=1433469 RepID=A0A9N8YYZ2_9GLOM|nr:5858_t:CDS:1 [Cetraspora pellucida]
MTRMLYSLYVLVLLVALCSQYLPVSIATSKYQLKNSILRSKKLGLNGLKKCEPFWWNNQKSYQKWTEREEWCTNDSEYHSSRKSKIWSNWKKFAQCQCESFHWDIRNPAGILVCYQIAWFNKITGRFVGELTVFKLDSMNKYKGKSSHVAFKFSECNVKVSKKRSHLKLDSSGFYYVTVPTFAWKKNGMKIQKFYVHGEISKNELMNKKISAKMLSPSRFKVIIDLKFEFDLENNYDAANLPLPNYLPNKPFSPFVGGCSSYPGMDYKKHKSGTRTTILPDNPTKPTDIPNKDTPIATSQPTDISNTPTTTQTPTSTTTQTTTQTPTQTPTPTPTSVSNPSTDPNPKDVAATITSDPSPKPTTNITNIDSPDSSLDSSPKPVNAADQIASTNTPLPGSTLGVVPIGLSIFGVIILIGAAFILYSRYRNRKWKRQYRRRQALRNETLATAPGFNVGGDGSNA